MATFVRISVLISFLSFMVFGVILPRGVAASTVPFGSERARSLEQSMDFEMQLRSRSEGAQTTHRLKSYPARLIRREVHTHAARAGKPLELGERVADPREGRPLEKSFEEQIQQAVTVDDIHAFAGALSALETNTRASPSFLERAELAYLDMKAKRRPEIAPKIIHLNLNVSRPAVLAQRTAEPISGSYSIVPGMRPGGFPLWKQHAGPHWLYSGSNGRWIIGGEREKNLGFKCADGVLASVSEHHGLMPNRLGPGDWQLLKPPQAPRQIVLSKSGASCPADYESIHDLKSCRDASDVILSSLDKSHRHADDVTDDPRYPPGCYLWTPPKGSRMTYFNTAAGATESHSRSYCKLRPNTSSAFVSGGPSGETMYSRSYDSVKLLQDGKDSKLGAGAIADPDQTNQLESQRAQQLGLVAQLPDTTLAGECKPCRAGGIRPLIGEFSAKLATATISSDPAKSRLGTHEGWSSDTASPGPDTYIEATFGHKMRVTHVIIEGVAMNRYVEEFSVGRGWPLGNARLNTSSWLTSTRELIPPLEDTYARLYPIKWKTQLAMTWNLLGCDCEPATKVDTKTDRDCAKCNDDNPVLPLIGPNYAKVISDNAITASSYDGAEGGFNEMWRSRIDWKDGGAWVSGSNEKGQYIEIDFKRKKRITHVLTRGRFDKREFVTSYSIGHAYQPENLVMTGNTDQYETVENVLFTPWESSAIKIFPLAWEGRMSMRLELMGCDCHDLADQVHHAGDVRGVPQYGEDKNRVCSRQLLGMDSVQLLQSADMASSAIAAESGCQNGQLHGPNAWCLLSNEQNGHGAEPWIMWDLGHVRRIESIQTQGNPSLSEWVTEYALEGAIGTAHWEHVGDFAGNNDQNTVKENAVDFEARFVRMLVKGFAKRPSVRVELVGCADAWNLPDKLDLGKLGGIHFNLIYPKLFHGRAFYFLDSDGDQQYSDSGGDKVYASSLFSFLPEHSHGHALDDANNILTVAGNLLRLPDRFILSTLLGPSATGSNWPAGVSFLSSTDYRSQKEHVALELVHRQGQVEYSKFDGKCTGPNLKPTPDQWADGATRFAGSAKLGSVLMCQELCTQHSVDCKGFTHDHSTGECQWHRGEFATSDQTFGFSCYVSKAFSCMHSFNICPDGFLRMTGDIWCEEECSRDACCNPLGLCSTAVCGHAHVLIENPPRFCQGPECTTEECCVPRGTCAPEICSKPERVPKLSTQIAFCANATCRPDECCDPVRTCSESDCPAPFRMRSEQPIYCDSQVACSMVECCLEAATCATMVCPIGSLEKSKETLCYSAKCMTEECCEVKGSCKNDFDTCPPGFLKKDPGEPLGVCDDVKCSVEECCENSPVCSPDVCATSGYQLKVTDSLISCAGSACTADECCEQQGRCDSSVCPHGYSMLQETEMRSEFCEARTCKVDECCKRAGTCTGNICPDGWAWKQVRDQPEFCKDSLCTRQECCDQLGQCTPDVCRKGYRVMHMPIEYCQSASCREEECCVKLGQCDDHAGFCSFGQGQVNKADPPEYCVDQYCTKEECCDHAGVCTHDLCPNGMVISYDAFCHGTVCTADECCTPVEGSLMEQPPSALVEVDVDMRRSRANVNSVLLPFALIGLWIAPMPCNS